MSRKGGSCPVLTSLSRNLVALYATVGPGMIFQALVFGTHFFHAVDLSWDVSQLHLSLPALHPCPCISHIKSGTQTEREL